MEIRTRNDGDLEGLVELAKRVREVDGYPIHLLTDDYVGFLERPTPFRAWVAVEASRPIGHVALNETTSPAVMQLVDGMTDDERPIYVARLMVDPGCRSRGLGRRLLQRASDAAFELECWPFLDVVDNLSARPAITLYRRTGWEEIGQVEFELGGRAVRELVFRWPRRAGSVDYR